MATQNISIPRSQCAVELEDKMLNMLSTLDGRHVLLISYILSMMNAEVSYSKVNEMDTFLISLDICCLFLVWPSKHFSLQILNKWKSKALSKGLDIKVHHVDIQSVYELDNIKANDRWGLPLKVFGVSVFPFFFLSDWWLNNSLKYILIPLALPVNKFIIYIFIRL